MIDFHAHILPGVDHGCTDRSMAEMQLQLAQEARMDTVVVTPHFYPHIDRLPEYLERRDRAFSDLLRLNNGKLHLLLGAEVLLCAGLDHMEGLKQLCIGQGNVLLLEMPFSPWTADQLMTVQRLSENPDFFPILAHVDRYPAKNIAELFKLGIPGQVNTEALCRLTGRKRLLDWIDNGYIRALGSDIHGTKHGYREYEKAVHYLGTERMHKITQRMTNMLKG